MTTTKKIGLVGGLSPESTVHYYTQICRGYNEKKGGLRFPPIVLESVNLQAFTECFAKNDWETVGSMLLAALANLKAAGAEFAAILANTPHHAWEHIAERSPIKVLTIMEAVASALLKDGRRDVALFGTRATMECGFFQRYFHGQGIETRVPEANIRVELDRIVWEELSHGIVRPESRALARSAIAKLCDDGAGAILLGCTELSMLIQSEDSKAPLYDSMQVHADAILAFALDGLPS